MPQEPKPASVVKSADRVLDIFELFAEHKEDMSLMDIARKLDLPTSSTYKILQNLLARGYLETDSHEKMFRLGQKLFEIGARYVQNISLTEAFQRVARPIVEEINETVYLAIRSGDKILYIAEQQSSQPVRFVSHVGMKLPLHSTALGKILLSYMDNEDIRQLYKTNELGVMTESTIQDLDVLMEQLEEVRKTGLAYSLGETLLGIHCIAAPIYNIHREMIAALSISILSARITDTLWQQTKELVQKAAKNLSIQSYYK
ncbi:IclR family transcriptional regulator [Paenibacillus psychroresistens]|nr:IclR family transcriptional regulator [Paenibacillus psychroresistens]